MSVNILVVANCQNNTVQLFVDDPSIVLNNSQGSSELFIKVPEGTNLQWRAVPLQSSEGNDDGQINVLISQIRLWGANPAQNQADASVYLINWGINNGASDAPCYANPGGISFSPEDGYQEAPSSNGQFPIQLLGTNFPFVECTTALGGRDDDGQSGNERVAYSFTLNIYKNSQLVTSFSFDPFIQVYRQ